MGTGEAHCNYGSERRYRNNLLTVCMFYFSSFLIAVKDGCQGPFIQTTYRTFRTTITFDYPRNQYKTSVKFFCKDRNLMRKDTLSTKFSKKNGTFTFTETNRGFSGSISNVSSPGGVYWGRMNTGSYHRDAFRKIKVFKGEWHIKHPDLEPECLKP